MKRVHKLTTSLADLVLN